MNLTLDRLLERARWVGDCLEHQASLNLPNGYPQMRVNGKRCLTHYLACELHHGPRPHGLSALHSCDNKRCIRKEHLSWGDHTRNGIEARDRQPSASVKLDRTKAALIRYVEEGALQAVASKYGVSIYTVSLIRLGKVWRDVTKDDLPRDAANSG